MSNASTLSDGLSTNDLISHLHRLTRPEDSEPDGHSVFSTAKDKAQNLLPMCHLSDDILKGILDLPPNQVLLRRMDGGYTLDSRITEMQPDNSHRSLSQMLEAADSGPHCDQPFNENDSRYRCVIKHECFRIFQGGP